MEDVIEKKRTSPHFVEKAVPLATKGNSNLEFLKQDLNQVEQLKILLEDSLDSKAQKIASLKIQIKSGQYEIHADKIAEELFALT